MRPGSPVRMFFVRSGVEDGVHDQLWQKELWKGMKNPESVSWRVHRDYRLLRTRVFLLVVKVSEPILTNMQAVWDTLSQISVLARLVRRSPFES